MNLRFVRGSGVQLITAAVAIGLLAGAVYMFTHNPRAPAVTLPLIDGRLAHSDDWRGKVVLVNFWATSCAICVKEMPALVDTYQAVAGPSFEMVAVAMAYDAPARVVHFARQRALPFKVAFDARGEIAEAFGDIAATPTTLLIDRNGHIVERIVGPPDFAWLQGRLRTLLALPT